MAVWFHPSQSSDTNPPILGAAHHPPVKPLVDNIIRLILFWICPFCSRSCDGCVEEYFLGIETIRLWQYTTQWILGGIAWWGSDTLMWTKHYLRDGIKCIAKSPAGLPQRRAEFASALEGEDDSNIWNLRRQQKKWQTSLIKPTTMYWCFSPPRPWWSSGFLSTVSLGRPRLLFVPYIPEYPLEYRIQASQISPPCPSPERHVENDWLS